VTRFLAAAVLLLAAGPAHAEPTEAHRALADQFDAESYAEREAASAALMSDDTLGFDDLRTLINGAETLEQRQRLLTVAQHHLIADAIDRDFLPAGMAALGLSYQEVPASVLDRVDDAGVLVVFTLTGFPANAALRPGDIITRVDGRPLPDGGAANRFGEVIQSHQAGAELDLTVYRGTEELTVQVELVSRIAMDAVFDQVTSGLKQPYLKRWEAARAALLADTEDPPTLEPVKHEAPD